jgi:hypothetical protein
MAFQNQEFVTLIRVKLANKLLINNLSPNTLVFLKFSPLIHKTFNNLGKKGIFPKKGADSEHDEAIKTPLRKIPQKG